jgi:hypothetical protein
VETYVLLAVGASMADEDEGRKKIVIDYLQSIIRDITDANELVL